MRRTLRRSYCLDGGHSPDVYPVKLSPIEEAYAESAYKASAYRGRLESASELIGETIYRPFKTSLPISQGYSGSHPAYDFPMPNGTELYNPFPGKAQVSFAGKTLDGYAYNLRLVYPPYSYMAVFAHLMRSFETLNGIKVGDWVEPLQMVCWSDNTGNSTGPHLHFEIRKPPYAGYANCINYWSMLAVLPDTPPEPTPPPPTGDITVPSFPLLPQWRTTNTVSLKIRRAPNTTSAVIGYIEPNTTLPAMAAQRVGKDLWIKIGHAEWIAGVYWINGYQNVWGEFVEEE